MERNKNLDILKKCIKHALDQEVITQAEAVDVLMELIQADEAIRTKKTPVEVVVVNSGGGCGWDHTSRDHPSRGGGCGNLGGGCGNLGGGCGR